VVVMPSEVVKVADAVFGSPDAAFRRLSTPIRDSVGLPLNCTVTSPEAATGSSRYQIDAFRPGCRTSGVRSGY